MKYLIVFSLIFFSFYSYSNEDISMKKKYRNESCELYIDKNKELRTKNCIKKIPKKIEKENKF